MSIKITIIGAGPAGYIAAFAAARKNAEVNLIEYDKLGGTCLNYGCIPTKTIKSSADALEIAHNLASFGISAVGEAKPDMPQIIARKNKVSDILRSGIEKSCGQFKINIIRGRAEIISAQRVKVSTHDGTIEEVISDKIIIATGSSSLELPALPVDHKYILSSDDALEMQYVPESIIIVGGGVIGAELAGIYSTLGAKITIVEGLNRLLPVPSVDEEMSKILQREMKKSGIKQELCQIVSSCKIENNKVYATLAPSPFLDTIPESAKNAPVLEADALILATGRIPNTQGLGLENAGIHVDAKGWVIANEFYETNIKDIYAIGDILGPSRIMLAHMASAEAEQVIENIFESTKKSAQYNICPSAIFTTPEIGCVGLSEAQALEQNREVECPIFQFRELGKAHAMGEIAGAFKFVVEKNSGKILGCHIAGAHASDLIAEASLAISLNASVQDIANTIHAHPTLAEGMYELAHKYAKSH